MFTVVIAEKEHMDSIREYQVFLKPFLQENKVEFCEWRPNEATLADSVPRLLETAAGHREWRAIVLCDESGLTQKNPFDLVRYEAPVRDPDRPKEDYLDQVRQAKFRAFEQAVEQPLTRLMTRLCESPLTTVGKNNASADDPEFAEYLAESIRKQELREQIIAGEELSVSYPAEVICVARRTFAQQDYDINTSWDAHEDIQYSRFYDWNLYFDKMRYLVFDVAQKNREEYAFDYIRFLYAVLILANNDTPSGVLRPNRVFCLNCENDETALARILTQYDAKLAQTGIVINAAVNEIRSVEKPRLSDRDAGMIFCSNINVPVTVSQEIDRSSLFADPKALGLSTDCPTDEYAAWDQTYRTSRKTLLKLLRQPRRALKSAAADMRRMNYVDLTRAASLNEFQLEDVKEHTGEEELNMVSVPTPDLFDTERYDKEMEESCRQVHRKIETRLTKKATLGVCIAALVLYLIGFLPLFFNNIADAKARLFALAVMGGAAVLLAAVAFVCLFFLRGALRKLYKAFNGVMFGITREIDGSLALYSRYLSHACNVMRGFSVLRYRERNKNPDAQRVQVLNKHLADIQRTREELREVFGPYFTPVTDSEAGQADAYPYDFSRPVDFPYPIPYTEGMKRQIEFMQTGVTVQVPVDFVKHITVRREELYD